MPIKCRIVLRNSAKLPGPKLRNSEREIQVNVDPYKMNTARVSFMDIENAISGRENNDITGGLIEVGNMKRICSKSKDSFQVWQIYKILLSGVVLVGAVVYLRDIAELKDTIKEKDSYARLDGKNVVTLNIVKGCKTLINGVQIK